MGLFSFLCRHRGPVPEPQAVSPEPVPSDLDSPEETPPPSLDEEPEQFPHDDETTGGLPGQHPSLDEATGPYVNSDDYLWDELHRIDLLVRAQTLRWRLTLATDKPEHLWGMIHVTDAEISTFMNAPFYPPGHLPPELEIRLTDYWDAAKRARKRSYERLKKTPHPFALRLLRLRRLFGFSDLEQDVLLVCLLPELDSRYRRLYGYLMDDASRTRATVELVIQILHPVASGPEAVRDALNAVEPLIAHQLLQVDAEGQGSESSLAVRSLRLDDRIEAFLLGSDRVDGRLKTFLAMAREAISFEQLPDDTEPLAQLKALSESWREEKAAHAVLLLQGPYGSGRLRAAQALCHEINRPLLIVDLRTALPEVGSWQQTVALVYREALLQGAAVCWQACELLFEREQPGHRWEQLLAAVETFSGLTFLVSEVAPDSSRRFRTTPFMRLVFPVPSYALRLKLWQTYLPQVAVFTAPAKQSATLAELLANSFQLTEGQICDAVATARWLALQRDPNEPRLTSDDFYEGCRRQSGRRLLAFARRIEPRTDLTFDDLIIPKSNRRQLVELRQRIRSRSRVYVGLGFERRLSLGKGLIALFTGSSGTGKTMAAELLAREQGVDLYKVDMSAVVSKYVGETEKNLSRVFAEAEEANAIILFDEADSLFGKRGEVKEAQDRWANMEVNYLLQRVEEYAGVVILTSNLRQNIDEAFLRRIHVIVDFPFPEAEARLHILCGLFPPGLERPDYTELEELAGRFKLSGGSFKNIVLDAAFRAFGEVDAAVAGVGQRHLVAATAREYQKLGKPITTSEFGKKYYDWLTEDIL